MKKIMINRKLYLLKIRKYNRILDLDKNRMNMYQNLAGKVFANGSGDLDSILGRVIPKTFKNDTCYLLAQHSAI